MTTTNAIIPIGATEAARLIGIQRANFVRDWASRPDFPPPIGELARGRVWNRDDVVRYALMNGPHRGTALSRIPMTPAMANVAPVLKRRIVRRFRPLRIVVFGSQARGDAKPDSDIDLLVVVPDGTDEQATARDIRAALRDLPISEDVIVVSESRVRRFGDIAGSVLNDALRKGVTIYAGS